MTQIEEVFPGLSEGGEEAGLLLPGWRDDNNPYELLDVFFLELLLLPEFHKQEDAEDPVLLGKAFEFVERLLSSSDSTLANATAIEIGETLAGDPYVRAVRFAGPGLMRVLRRLRAWSP